MRPRRLEHVERAEDVRPRVGDRIGDGHADVDLGREMEDDVGTDFLEEVAEWLRNVARRGGSRPERRVRGAPS